MFPRMQRHAPLRFTAIDSVQQLPSCSRSVEGKDGRKIVTSVGGFGSEDELPSTGERATTQAVGISATAVMGRIRPVRAVPTMGTDLSTFNCSDYHLSSDRSQHGASHWLTDLSYGDVPVTESEAECEADAEQYQRLISNESCGSESCASLLKLDFDVRQVFVQIMS